MPHRDRWTHERDPRDRDWERRELRAEDDFGQADYSTDYGYDPRTRTGYRAADDYADRDDFGQADYSEDFGYDARSRAGYRRSDPEARRAHETDDDYDYRRETVRETYDPRDREVRREVVRHDYDDDRRYDRRGYRDDDYRRGEGRSFMDQARDFFGVSAYEDRRDDRRHRQGRVIWAVINGRFDHERGLDARDVEVIVDGTEVILNGTVRSREEKRLAEDLADVRGVTHIQNNLRVGRRGFWR